VRTLVLISPKDGPLTPEFSTNAIGSALDWGGVWDTPMSFVWDEDISQLVRPETPGGRRAQHHIDHPSPPPSKHAIGTTPRRFLPVLPVAQPTYAGSARHVRQSWTRLSEVITQTFMSNVKRLRRTSLVRVTGKAASAVHKSACPLRSDSAASLSPGRSSSLRH
jgi:hypothetical protein